LVHHLKRQLHLQLVTIGMSEEVRALSNAGIEPNSMLLVDVSIEQSGVRSMRASDRVGLRNAATVLTQFHFYGIHKTGNCS
jgi:hypothetical protein